MIASQSPPSGQHSIKMPTSGGVKQRSACDRCHGQKLRCPKSEHSTACTRCLRAGATCVFGGPARARADSLGVAMTSAAGGDSRVMRVALDHL